MTLIKKFSAPLIAVALVAMMAVSLVGQSPRIASALQVAGEPCRQAANTTSTFLGNATSTGAVTSVNSGTTTTLRIHFDDSNSSTAVARLVVGGGSVNGQPATSSSNIFITYIDANAQLCVASGLGQTGDADAVLAAADDSYIQFSFTAPTLPSGIQSQLIQFQVDGNNDGDVADVSDGTYFLTVATAAASITVGTPDDLNISATAANTDAAGAAIVATVRDAAGTAITGATVDVVTTAGGLDQSGGAGTCDANNAAGTADTTGTNLSQACAAQTDANGQVIPTLYGLGAGGTATVTFTVRGTSVSGSTTVIISALPATLEVSGRRTNTATSFVSKTIVERTDSSTTNRDELLIAAVAKDANGNVVGAGNVTFTLTGPAGHTITFVAAVEQLALTGAACSVSGAGTNSCVDAIEAAAVGASTPSHAVAVIDIDSTAGEPLGTYTVTATIAGNNATITGTTTFTLAKAPATLTIGDIPTVGLGQTQSVSITCKDADGNPCAMGTLVQVNVSNANLIAQNTATGTTGVTVADLTTNATGVATVSLIGVTSGQTNIVANVGTVTAVASVTVGTGPVTPPVTPPPASTGFSGTIAPAGLTIVSFTGTTAQLTTAGQAAKVITASATVTVSGVGKLVTFVIGAPEFVNVEFNAAFPTGMSNTFLIVKTGS